MMADYENIFSDIPRIDKLCLDTIREFSDDTVYFKDRESNFVWNSKRHATQVGAASPEEMRGKSDLDYFPEKFAQEARKTEIDIMQTGKPHINIPEELDDPDGTTHYFLASKYPFYNEDKEIIGTWGMTRDITEQKHMEKELERSNLKLQRLARVDDLSGLYNRRYFYETLERTIAIYSGRAGSNNTFALIAIDVDNLKYINDKYGHPHGDDVLRMIASSLVCNTTKADTCFRVGGDEFMVMLPDSNLDKAIQVAQRLVDAVASTTVPMGDTFEKMTISLGVAIYENGTDISEIISLADRKLYKSKRNGKNQVSS